MSGHTKGPWKAINFQGHTPGIVDVWQIHCENHAVCTTQFCYAPNTEANARLIAAAPDLLEALVAAQTIMASQGWGRGPTGRMVDAAIARATGAQI